MRSIRQRLVSLTGFFLVLVPLVCGDSARPPEKEEYFSANGEYCLTVDPGDWNEDSDTRLILKSTSQGVILDVTQSYFEKFRYPLHACISNDGAYLVFGGVSCHNMSSGTEGLRIYRRSGSLVRFVPMARLPYGFQSASTQHWYDESRCRIDERRKVFLLYRPKRRSAISFRLEDGLANPKSGFFGCSGRRDRIIQSSPTQQSLNQVNDDYSDLPESRVWGTPFLRLALWACESKPGWNEEIGFFIAMLLSRQNPKTILVQASEGSITWKAVCYAALSANAASCVDEEGTPLFLADINEEHKRAIAETLALQDEWKADGATHLTRFISTPDFVPILEHRLRDESLPGSSYSLRAASVQGYVNNRGADAAPLLLELLENSKDYGVREQCARFLGNLRESSACPALMRVTETDCLNPKERENVDRVRRQALIALGRIGNPDALPVLERVLRRDSLQERGTRLGMDYIKVYAVDAAATIGGPEAEALLQRVAEDPLVDSETAEYAAQKLAMMLAILLQ